jgi:predicted phosphodiesterase
MIDWKSVPGEVITVISDLHANKRAVKAALEAVKQKRSDRLIILGDILTYGIDTIEVMETVQGAIDAGALLLIGNHDEMYLDLIRGHSEILPKLRQDLQESIVYNFEQMNTKQFASWDWKKEIVYDNIYFSHANPYGNCWEYIKSQEDFLKAAYVIQDQKHLAGVFGHTHRSICFGLKKGILPQIDGLEGDTFIINPGSIGQPRSTPRQASLLRLSSYQNKLWAEIESVEYDMRAHVEDLRNSSLSPHTKAVLISFFEK